MLLRDRTVIVSGVGPGLGRDLALACAREGARLVLVARDGERLRTIEAEIGDAASTHRVAADAADADEASRIVEETLARFGTIDGLVNNAAVVPPLTQIAAAPLSDVEQSLDANFLTAFHLTRAVVPTMVARQRGSVVMVNSAILRHPKPDFGAYNIAKHALLGFARSLALELGPSGIRVNTLAPGKIDGERLSAYFEVRAQARGVPVEAVRAEYASNLSLRRLPSGAEYADVAVFLLSDLSRAITGHVLDANGGEYFD
ncbi:MAG: SDR family oxidoreductase [Actinobacteria bacterium]|nr:SDR family oxidoreductase [Actinomycetota bacterium]